jgi:hypothetical protein
MPDDLVVILSQLRRPELDGQLVDRAVEWERYLKSAAFTGVRGEPGTLVVSWAEATGESAVPTSRPSVSASRGFCMTFLPTVSLPSS